MPKIIEVAAIDATINAFALPLMDGLRQLGFEVAVAAANTGFTDKIRGMGYAVHNVDFVRSLSPTGNARALYQLSRLIAKEKPDIIHTHTPIASALTRVSAGLMGTEVFYTLHGLKTQFPFLQLEGLMCRRLTSHVFVINPVDYGFIRKGCHVPRKNITVLNGVGINTGRFDPKSIDPVKAERLRAELGLGKEPVIGFVGRLVREKGIITLIDAFTALNVSGGIKPKLLVVGSADLNERDTKTISRLRRIIQCRGIKSSVIFTGYRADLPELLSLMDIFALPSYIEGMCVSTLEAMAMELPVVATDIRGIREEVTPECGILVAPGDSRALAAALSKLLRRPSAAIEMGRNGRRRVLELFDEERVLDAQLKVFSRHIVKGKK